MLTLPEGVDGSEEHELVVLFESDLGCEAPARRYDTAWVRAGCRCGWRAAGRRALDRAVSATDGRVSNAVEVEAQVGRVTEELRLRWWREHLTLVLPTIDLAAAMPGLRLGDGLLADAVASAWVDGASWAQIAEAVGTSRQAAHRRWRHAVVEDADGRRTVPGDGGRPRRRELPGPSGWPTLPGWSHPAPEAASEHEPLAWGVSLGGQETVGITAKSAYAGAGCTCGWRVRGLEVPDVPSWERRAALDAFARQLLAPAWNEHLHRALPTLRLRAQVARTVEDAAHLTELVVQARDRGATWQQVGRAVGMTTQGAQDRWRSTARSTPTHRASPRRARERSVLRAQSRA